MIHDFRTIRSVPVSAGAVIIVGSGAAGLALAEKLAAAQRQVILFESGGDVASAPVGDSTSGDLNVGTIAGLPYAGLEKGRTRVIGGAAQLWHGQCMRMYDIDLQQRSWVSNSGWPLTLAELDDHYANAERWLGVSGLGYGMQRWSEHPRVAPLSWDSRCLLHDFTEYAPRPLLGSEHRANLSANRFIDVYVHATVTRLTVAGDRIDSVEVSDPTGRRLQVSSGVVVLAGGAIENARLLQLSDPDGVGLGAGKEHTGRYLQDHPVVTTADIVSSDYRILQNRYIALHRGRRRLFPKVRLSPEAQREHGLLDATAVFVHDHQQPGLAAARRLVLAARARRAPEHPMRDVLTALGSPVPVARDTYRRYVRGLATGTRPAGVTVQVWLEQQPDPQSRITLGLHTDALGLRRAVVDWRVSDLEIETSRRMTRWIAADLERLGVAQVHLRPLMTDDTAWRGGVTDAYHPAGTTRMSRTPADGVVSPDLEVHGVAGLYAVGGSVFPIAGYANPTLTIVALALRLGDLLITRAPTPVG